MHTGIMKLWRGGAALVLSAGMVMTMLPVMAQQVKAEETHTIVLSDGNVTVDGSSVTEYDYTWHADPAHTDEYFTGTEPTGEETVYITHDIRYYPEVSTDSFHAVTYDDDTEWATYYTAEDATQWIFGTLPYNGGTLPTSMMHSASEAYANPVLNITEAGTYRISGTWKGQIAVNLGKSSFSDATQKVTIILDGADVTCTVAPAFIVYNAYECDNSWEERTAYSQTVDTSDAGVNIILADGSVNNFTGENVYRLLKAEQKSSGSSNSRSVTLQKKRMKYDGAFYSTVTMNITGETAGTGTLNITAGYEGLDTELHLTINGGNINIYAQDDGINVNEDDVSVVTFNGGTTHILGGLGREGDGVDSNGYVVVNGGTVISTANPGSDSGLDSDKGSYVNGGTVVALGSTMDFATADTSAGNGQPVMNLRFASSQDASESIRITDTNGNAIFTYDPATDSALKTYARSYSGAVITAPGLQQGTSYYVYVGGKQQCYTTTGNQGGGRGQGRPGGQTPPDMPGDGQTPPEMPDNQGAQPGTQQGTGSSDGVILFTLSSRVNTFSGVTDYSGSTVTPLTFSDEVAGAWYVDAVEWAAANNISAGIGNGLFGIGQPLKRSEAVQLLYAISGKPVVTTAAPFIDLTADWYKDAVNWAADLGITAGVDATHFNPDGTASRAEAVTFLYNYVKGSGGSSTFSDVPQGSWFYAPVAWAASNGITAGTGNNLFEPGTQVTREQFVQFLYNLAH